MVTVRTMSGSAIAINIVAVKISSGVTAMNTRGGMAAKRIDPLMAK
jgi:hypothetical protein